MPPSPRASRYRYAVCRASCISSLRPRSLVSVRPHALVGLGSHDTGMLCVAAALLCSSARMQFMLALLCLSHPADATIARAYPVCPQRAPRGTKRQIRLSSPSSIAATRACSHMSLKGIGSNQKAHWRVTGICTSHTHNGPGASVCRSGLHCSRLRRPSTPAYEDKENVLKCGQHVILNKLLNAKIMQTSNRVAGIAKVYAVVHTLKHL